MPIPLLPLEAIPFLAMPLYWKPDAKMILLPDPLINCFRLRCRKIPPRTNEPPIWEDGLGFEGMTCQQQGSVFCPPYSASNGKSHAFPCGQGGNVTMAQLTCLCGVLYFIQMDFSENWKSGSKMLYEIRGYIKDMTMNSCRKCCATRGKQQVFCCPRARTLFCPAFTKFGLHLEMILPRPSKA